MIPRPPFQHKGRRCFALVITLAFVVIITLVLLLFINVVTMDRVSTRNYAQEYKAAEIARGADAFILGQLREEMTRGGSPLVVGNYSIFTNVTSANILPQAVGTDPSVPALIKNPAAGAGMYSGAASAAVNASSSSASANGRKVRPGRWGRPGLGTTAVSPNWFLVGPRGITNTSSPDVEGRFSFAVYDLGSLVDINVAGHPSSLSAAEKRSIQGTLAGLDLTSLGLDSTATDELIKNFRNRTTSATYTNQILNVAATNGFLRVAPGDDNFLTRQDFLAYAKLKGVTKCVPNFSTFSRTVNSPAWSPATNAGTFNNQIVTRTSIVNWSPQAGAATSSLSVNYNYHDEAIDAASTNRAFLSQSVVSAFTRADGSTAVVGDPLMTKRFPLSRLAWLSKDGPSATALSRFGSASGAAQQIKASFGLVWDSINRLWVYTSPAASNGGGAFTTGNSDGPVSSGKLARTIKTLAVVASEGREPDFFELLQAGILKGSLAQRSSIATPEYIPTPGEVTPEGHILQIGANIIDQYDADDFPTLIRAAMPAVMDGSAHAYDFATTTSYVVGADSGGLTPHDFAGVESIPYLMTFRTRAFRPEVGNSADGARRYGQGILMPQFWNPHQGAETLGADRPEKFRIMQTFGEIRMVFMGNKRGSPLGSPFIDPPTGELFGYVGYQTSPPSAWPSATGGTQPLIEFSSGATFAQPGFLNPANVTATSRPENLQPALAADEHTKADLDATGFVGFWLGSTPAPGTAFSASVTADEADDNTPVDREAWAIFTGRPQAECPVQQYIASVCSAVRRNPSPLPATDRFWKGDVSLANYNYRWPVFELQYLDGGVWKTYQRFDGVIRGGGDDHKWDTYATTFTPYNKYAGSFSSESHAAMYARIDPRGSRLGLIRADDPAALYNGAWNGDPNSYRHRPLSGVVGTTGRPTGDAIVNFNGVLLTGNQSGAEFTTAFDPSSDATRWVAFRFADWVDNVATSQRYADGDRIMRRADGDTAAGVDPLGVGTEARPIILNRPFTSVADLGNVYRDLPFKTLDFFSKNSADAGLLDLFCVEESPTIAAGKVQLNGRNSAVMAALLQSAVKNQVTGDSISDPEAASVGDAMVNASKTQAFTGIWALPAFLESSEYRSATTGSLGNMKSQMETVPRRMVGLADARCWNLLIDVVAQSGRFPSNLPAVDLDRFVVEGERRYWLSIAIDRYTGKVIAQQLEQVSE